MNKKFNTNRIIITILLLTLFLTGCTSPQNETSISEVTSKKETPISKVTSEENTPDIEETIVAESEITQILDVAEMQFIKENSITLEKSLNKNILFSTQTAKLSGEPENIKGLLCFEGIEAFDSSERFEVKEGYEWRKINCSGIFNPQEYEAIRDKGVDFGWGFADAQTGTGFIESKKDIESVENNGQNFQTQTWNIGEKTFDITIASVFQSGWVEQSSGNVRWMRLDAAIQVPKDYKGLIFYFETSEFKEVTENRTAFLAPEKQIFFDVDGCLKENGNVALPEKYGDGLHLAANGLDIDYLFWNYGVTDTEDCTFSEDFLKLFGSPVESHGYTREVYDKLRTAGYYPGENPKKEQWFLNLSEEEQRKEIDRPIDGLIPVALYKMLAPYDWFNNMTPEEQRQEILYCKARQQDRIPQPWETEVEWRERMEQEAVPWYSSDYVLDYEKIYQDIEQEEIEWYGTSDYVKWGN